MCISLLIDLLSSVFIVPLSISIFKKHKETCKDIYTFVTHLVFEKILENKIENFSHFNMQRKLYVF